MTGNQGPVRGTAARIGTVAVVLVALLAATTLAAVVVPDGPAAAITPAWVPVAARLDQATTACAELCGLEMRATTDGAPLYDAVHGDWQRDRFTLIASSSKWFGGATIMSAVDDGVLSLDDTVADFFPQHAGTPTGAITVAQLASMTHGLQSNSACLNVRTTTLAACADEILAQPLAFTPGTMFDYGSTGLQVAGRIVEIAEGDTWENVFRRNIANPLGLTRFVWAVAPTANPLIAGGAATTASEYDRFLEMVQHRGAFRGTRVLSESAVTAMETNRARGLPARFTPSAEAAGYGIGNWIEVEHPDGTAAVVSSPGLFGTYPLVSFDADARVLVVAFKAQFGSLATRGIMVDLRPMLTSALNAPPGAPAAPVAYAGDGTATVQWGPPTEPGGATVTAYTVTASPGGATCTWVSGPRWCSVAGLANGTPYTFRVTATSAKGSSPASPPSAPVTPRATADTWFHPLTPVRVLDSRAASHVGPFTTPWGAGATRDVVVAGTAGVPSGADAVVLNVTTTGTTDPSYLKVWPKGAPRPATSATNWTAGQTIANAVTVAVGADGSVSAFNAKGSADVIVDVVGWFDGDAGAGYTPLTPERVLDSRPASQVGPHGTPWGPATQRDVVVAGAGSVPPGADAVVLNITATETTAASHLTVFPTGADRPIASSLNWSAGQTIANAVTVPVGADGSITVANSKGSVDVVVDVVGWFDEGTGVAFHPVAPARVADSRPPVPVGAHGTPWGPGTQRDVPVGGAGGVPATADAVVAKFTVTNTTAASHLTVWPSGATKPRASSLNWPAGVTISNEVTTPLGTAGGVRVTSPAGQVDVIVDVAGWFG